MAIPPRALTRCVPPSSARSIASASSRPRSNGRWSPPTAPTGRGCSPTAIAVPAVRPRVCTIRATCCAWSATRPRSPTASTRPPAATRVCWPRSPTASPTPISTASAPTTTPPAGSPTALLPSPTRRVLAHSRRNIVDRWGCLVAASTSVP